MAENQGSGGLKNLFELLACLAFAALKTTHSFVTWGQHSFWDQGRCGHSKGCGGDF